MEKAFLKAITFTQPQGGLFSWVELPANINARDVLVKSLEKNVAFVPSGSFPPNGGKEYTFRINFSNMPEDRIRDRLERLAGVLGEFIK
jgi:2-aminoadipate transaminase